MTVVAIHQPNYLPWLGYFHKIACADLFVFLDNVQFSKNGYCNRVQVLHELQRRWLSVPVSYHFGDAVDEVSPARPDWPRRHLDSLRGYYRESPYFSEIARDLDEFYREMPQENLAAANRHLVECITQKLGFEVRFIASSELELGDARGDERLVRIMQNVAPGGVYLSGHGGVQYQDERKFAAAGATITHANFIHARYEQGSETFVPGLSVIDAAFWLGWEETAHIVIDSCK